jgi:hypothetical protein
MKHAKTSFSDEIFAGAIISAAQYLAPLRYIENIAFVDLNLLWYTTLKHLFYVFLLLPYLTPQAESRGVVQAHPQSWRYTAMAFNCILIAATLFFAACLSSAKLDAAQSSATSADEGFSESPPQRGHHCAPADHGSSQHNQASAHSHFLTSVSKAIFNKRQHRHRGQLLPTTRESLETVAEVGSSCERLSSSFPTSPGSVRLLDSATSRSSAAFDSCHDDGVSR